MTNILITFGLEPELVERVRQTAPGATVRVLGVEAVAAYKGERRFPPNLQPLTTRDEMEEALPDAEIVFGWWGGDLAKLDLPKIAPKLRWVQITQVGTEGVPPELIGAGITFTGSAGYASIPVAEFVLTYLLMFSKRYPGYFQAQAAREVPKDLPLELHGATVGIVGYGNIGQEVARLAKPFGVRIIGCRRSATGRSGDGVADEVVGPADLDYLLASSDYVVLTAPATAQTRELVGASQLKTMKASAFLINVARGSLIEESALIEALKSGEIAGAALDVFASNHLAPDSELWGLANVILTHHVTGFTQLYNPRATEIFCDNLRRYLAGEPMRNVVDPERGY